MAQARRWQVSSKSLWSTFAAAVAAGTLAVGIARGADDRATENAPADAPAKKAAAKAADDKAAAGDQVTYAKHIQPILKEACVNCHRVQPARGPGAGGAPGGPGARPGPGGPGGRPGGPGGPGGGGPRGPAGGLRLDDKAAILKGGKHGKVVIPGKADQSLLYKVLKEPVTIDGEQIHSMPKARPGQEFPPIADEDIELIRKWIDQGAK